MRIYEVPTRKGNSLTKEQLELNTMQIRTYMLSGFSLEHMKSRKMRKAKMA